jgi:uridine phosphorylase
METFHLLHLASCWPRRSDHLRPGRTGQAAPPFREPADSHIVDSEAAAATDAVPQFPPIPHDTAADLVTGPRIRAAAVQMIFADRSSQGFITPEQVGALENEVAIGLLEAIIAYDIPKEVRRFIGGCRGATV